MFFSMMYTILDTTFTSIICYKKNVYFNNAKKTDHQAEIKLTPRKILSNQN